MAAPFNKILSKCEDAVAARLALVATESGIASGSIHSGGAPITEDVALPSATVVAASAEPRAPVDAGIWDVNVTVEVHTSATEARATRAGRLGYLVDLFIMDVPTVSAALTASVTDFTVMGYVFRGVTQRLEGHRHVAAIELLLVCCAAD